MDHAPEDDAPADDALDHASTHGAADDASTHGAADDASTHHAPEHDELMHHPVHDQLMHDPVLHWRMVHWIMYRGSNEYTAPATRVAGAVYSWDEPC